MRQVKGVLIDENKMTGFCDITLHNIKITEQQLPI